MDTRTDQPNAPARSPDTTPRAGGVATPHPAADSERSRTCASLIALVRHLVRAVGGDGPVPGIARCLLAALYATALLNGFRSADATALQVMALVFITIYAFVLDDWREALRVLFAPDVSLWRFPTGWSLLDRVGMAAYRQAVFWAVMPFLCAGLPFRPEWILPLPLLASLTQRALEKVRQRLHQRRLARLPSRAECGAPSATSRGTPSVPGTQFHNSVVTDRVSAGGPHGGGPTKTSF